MAENRKLEKKHIAILLIAVAMVGIFAAKGFSQSSPESVAAGNLAHDVDNIAASCAGLDNKEQCYAKAFENLTKATDRDYAFNVLRALQQEDEQARGCHFIAHAISTAETEKNPANWKELMNTAPPDCSYGAVHGALEVYASTFPNGELPKAEIPNLCDNPDLNNCTHGLGHLLLVMDKDDIDEAVRDCNTLPHDHLGKFECITGAFMERITAVNLEIHGLAGPEALNWPARVPELEALCRKQAGVTSVACWKEIVHAVLIKIDNDPQKLVDFCESAPGEDETRQCIDHALGIIAGAYNFDLSRLTPVCDARAQAGDFQERCYAHLVSATISTVPQESASAVRFCNSLSSAYQESCFTMLGNSLYHGKPEYKTLLAKECLKAPINFRERCAQGGNSKIPFYTGD